MWKTSIMAKVVMWEHKLKKCSLSKFIHFIFIFPSPQFCAILSLVQVLCFSQLPVTQRRLAVTELDRKNFITKHSVVSFIRLHQEKLMLWPHCGLQVIAYRARIHCIEQPEVCVTDIINIWLLFNKDRPTWCHLFYYFTIYCSTCFEC